MSESLILETEVCCESIREKQEKIWPKFKEILDRNRPLYLVDQWITRDLFSGGKGSKKRHVKHRISHNIYGDQIFERGSERDALEWRIFTDSHEFRICAHSELDTGKTYLTAFLRNRKCEVGENHHRGADLLDGPIDEDRWRGICMQMLRMELLPLWEPCDDGFPTSHMA